jgi:Predicted transcriptional regulator with an HTH domain
MSKFFERFRLLKEESGVTLKQMSEKLHITIPNLSYYMKGREPSYDILIKIADYFNVTTDWLIGRKMNEYSLEERIIKLENDKRLLTEKLKKIKEITLKD